MKSIIAFSLFLVIMLISGFTYAAVDQPNQPLNKFDQCCGINQSGPHAVFAGPKVGWIILPVAEGNSVK
jgi:hypothetical protein